MPRRGGTGFSFGNRGKQSTPDYKYAIADARSEIENESDCSLSAGSKLISPEQKKSDFKQKLNALAYLSVLKRFPSQILLSVLILPFELLSSN